MAAQWSEPAFRRVAEHLAPASALRRGERRVRAADATPCRGRWRTVRRPRERGTGRVRGFNVPATFFIALILRVTTDAADGNADVYERGERRRRGWTRERGTRIGDRDHGRDVCRNITTLGLDDRQGRERTAEGVLENLVLAALGLQLLFGRVLALFALVHRGTADIGRSRLGALSQSRARRPSSRRARGGGSECRGVARVRSRPGGREGGARAGGTQRPASRGRRRCRARGVRYRGSTLPSSHRYRAR